MNRPDHTGNAVEERFLAVEASVEHERELRQAMERSSALALELAAGKMQRNLTTLLTVLALLLSLYAITKAGHP